MSAYTQIVKRSLLGILLIFGTILMNFVLVRLAPGDPAYILGGEAGASPEFVAQVREEFGLDKPLSEQLIIYLEKIVHGDLGYSYFYRKSVTTLIVNRFPATLLLVISSFSFAIAMGIFFGTITALNPRSFISSLVRATILLGYSIPSFWLGQMLIVVFAVELGWLPTGGLSSPISSSGIQHILDVLSHLILPTLSLGIFFQAVIMRLTHGSMLDVLTENYIILAKAKGVSKNTILIKHVLRNALLPVVTTLGMTIKMIFSGAVITETIFSWPGLGRLLYDSLVLRDFPVITGIFIFVAITIVISNITIDALYTLLDPRIRYQKKR